VTRLDISKLGGCCFVAGVCLADGTDGHSNSGEADQVVEQRREAVAVVNCWLTTVADPKTGGSELGSSWYVVGG